MDPTTTTSGDQPAAAAPAAPSSLPGTDALTANVTTPASAPVETQNAAPSAATVPTEDAAAQPGIAQPSSGIAGIMNSVLSMLAGRDTSTQTIDANGRRVVTPGQPLTRGQQIAAIALTALKGATTAAAAPPGPGHVGAGVAAAVSQSIGDQQAAAHAKQENADHDFAIQQKAKLDNVNYQLATRKIVAADFELQQKGVKATQENIDFANKLEDREKGLGSYDLGIYKDESELPSVMAKQPAFMQKLYKEQGIIAVPMYRADGTRQGIHVYERKPDTNAALAPEGTVAHKFTLGDKPGDGPRMSTFTPVGASNADIDSYNRKAMLDQQAYEKAQDEDAKSKAQTAEANANAKAKPIESRARMIEAVASAAKSNAEARKTNIEAQNEDATAGGSGSSGGNAAMMVEGLSSPSLMSKRSKTYDAMLPAANAYSLQKYGVPFDAEVSEGRYQARKATIKQYAEGKEGDQIQSLNQFFGHSASLAGEVDQLRNTNSPFLNVPIKELRKQMGDARYAQISPLIYAVRKEYQNFLTNNMALHNEDITEGAGMLNDTQSLAQMEGAIKGFGGAAITRAGQMNQRYKRVVQTGDVPGLIDDNTRGAIKRLGLEKHAQQDLGTAWTAPNQPSSVTPPGSVQPQPQQQPQHPAAIPVNHPQQAAAAGVPAGAQAGYQNGRLVGYQDAQGWHSLTGAN